jgi:hypothetical protein
MQSLGKTKLGVVTGLLVSVLLVWLALSAFGVWHYASQETEPPVFDALSYVQKAQTFWAAVNQGRLFNPLDLEPQIRPFGTVFFTHPFGFSEDFRPFYFLSCFLPSLILLLGITVAAGRISDLSLRQRYVLVLLLLIATSLPSYYQFASKEGVQVMGAWGFVDILFGALGAVAIGFVVNPRVDRTLFNAVVSAGIAVLTIFIKPAGLTLMAIVGGAWVVVQATNMLKGVISRKAFIRGFAVYVLFYLLTALALYRSHYFSKENYQYGIRSMELLHAAQTSFPSIQQIATKLHVGFGAPMLVLWLIGFLCTIRARKWDLACLSALSLVGGSWLWLGRTNIEHVRYFFPFPLMALVFVVPALIRASKAWGGIRLGLATLLILPTLLIGYLLTDSAPSASLQRVAGINLATNLHATEVAQAKKLAGELALDPSRKSIIYYCGVAPNVKAVEGVMDWNRILGFAGGNSIPDLPIDWVREAAFRLDEIIDARFLVLDDAPNPDILDKAYPDVKTYEEEQAVIRAWLSSLGPAQGVMVRSLSDVRVLEVVDRRLLAVSAAELFKRHTWRQAFLDGYHPFRFLNGAELSSVPDNLLTVPIELSLDGHPVARIGAFTRKHESRGDEFDVYIEQVGSLPPEKSDAWLVFVHVTGPDGKFLAAYAPFQSDGPSTGIFKRYRIKLPESDANASSFAVGVFRQDPKSGTSFLISTTGEWGGRRNVIPVLH